MVPMPLEPPCTSSTSPGRSPAVRNTLLHTVQVTSGSPPASTSDTPAGAGSSCPAGTATSSAYPPPASTAHTGAPTSQPSTPSPSASTVPLHSRPRYSEAPGGGG